MIKKIFGILQRIGRSFMLPIAVLPIAGLFLGVGSCLTNPATIASLGLDAYMGEGSKIYAVFLLLMHVGQMIFDNLPLIFACSVASGMAKKSKEVAVISAVIAFFAMHTTIHGLLNVYGIIEDNIIVKEVVSESIVDVFGQLSLEMGVFGGIIVGLGVSFLHNHFYTIQLPDFLSFFEGERFVPIISTVVFIFMGFLFFHIWPPIQAGINVLGTWIARSGYGGTFIYGIVKRSLVPFGLHHIFYMPFYQTAIGGSMTINGNMVVGAQNIFFAQLSDPTLTHFSLEATRYFSGEFLIMMFGLPGGALAMYHQAKDESKKVVKSLFLSAALTSILTGITEPIEFAFIFVAPMLFVAHVFFAGTAFVLAQILKITIGFTFSCGFIDFFIFGILQGNDKTNWIYIIVIGIIYFFLYYGTFTFLIKKFDLKTPGREEDNKLTIFNKKKMDYSFDKSLIDPQVQLIIQGLGGRHNFVDLDCCITRIRASLIESDLVVESDLKKAGAAAVLLQGNAIQIIFGPKASSLKTKIDDYIANVPEAYDENKEISYGNNILDVCNIVDGDILPIEDCVDDIFKHKLLGDGIMIRPRNGFIVSPIEGEITMIYPTKHAIGIKNENGIELLIHVGINTVQLNGQGFDLFVNMNQKVRKGDLLWNLNLDYIKNNATDDCILIVFTQLVENAVLEKQYGYKNSEDIIINVKK